MRGRHEEQEVMLAYVNLEERVPNDHPLRTIKAVADEALNRPPEFDRMYSRVGRASVGAIAEGVSLSPSTRCAREGLLRGAGIQSAVPLVPGEPDSVASTPQVFTKNRKRLLELWARGCSTRWYGRRYRGLLSDEHFRGRDADRGSGQHQELPNDGMRGSHRTTTPAIRGWTFVLRG